MPGHIPLQESREHVPSQTRSRHLRNPLIINMLFNGKCFEYSRIGREFRFRVRLALRDVIQAHNGKASGLAPCTRERSASRPPGFAPVWLARRLGAIELNRVE